MGAHFSIRTEKGGTATLLLCGRSARIKLASIAPEGALVITPHLSE